MLRHALAFDAIVHTAQPRLLGRVDRAWPAADGVEMAHPTGHVGRFRLAVDARQLEIAGDIAAPPGWTFSPRQDLPAWYLYDHVVIFLDPPHDHTTQRMLAVMRNGEVVHSDLFLLAGEEVSDNQSVPLKLQPLKTHLEVRDEPGGGWRFRLRTPLASLRRQPGVKFPAQPLGIRLKFGVAAPTTHPAPAWPATDPFWKDNPMAFADLHAPRSRRSGSVPGLTLTRIDFGAPVWTTGRVRSTVALTARLTGPAANRPTAGSATLRIVDPMERATLHRARWISRRGRIHLTLPADYPFTAKWAPNILNIGRLEIDLTTTHGKLLWSARYPFGFDAGVLVREPFGQLTGRAAVRRRPAPTAANFVDQYRAWLLTHLPAWQWQTTNDGAPSDFFLRAPGRGPAARHRDINLMSPTVFADLANLIHRIFRPLSPAAHGWQDALCAAAMVLHHPCLTVHSGSWARIAGNAHTDTVLRLGGCFCSDCARIAARLAEEIGRLYRIPLKGFDLGLHGHLTGLVETPLGEVLLDPMLGLYYHTLDNRRLATLDEMRADKRIQQRMWTLAYNHGHEFFYRVYNQTKAPWVDGPVQFPPNS